MAGVRGRIAGYRGGAVQVSGYCVCPILTWRLFIGCTVLGSRVIVMMLLASPCN